MASTKNIKVISDELKELNQLEIEHVELRKRFLEYLQIADKEIIKNQKSIERLEKLEKELFRLRSKGEGDALELDFVSRERTDRNVWKDDASIKVNKAKNRCAEIEKNMKEIEQRRSSLKSEHKSWTERVEEYQKLRKDLTDRKEEYERMAKGK